MPSLIVRSISTGAARDGKSGCHDMPFIARVEGASGCIASAIFGAADFALGDVGAWSFSPRIDRVRPRYGSRRLVFFVLAFSGTADFLFSSAVVIEDVVMLSNSLFAGR